MRVYGHQVSVNQIWVSLAGIHSHVIMIIPVRDSHPPVLMMVGDLASHHITIWKSHWLAGCAYLPTLARLWSVCATRHMDVGLYHMGLWEPAVSGRKSTAPGAAQSPGPLQTIGQGHSHQTFELRLYGG